MRRTITRPPSARYRRTVTCYVFLGPTLPAAEAAAALDAVILPPVRQGDMLRLVQPPGPGRSGSSTATFGPCRPAGTRRSCSLSARAYMSSAPPAWARFAPRNSTASAWSASGATTSLPARPFPPFDGERFEGDDEVAVVHGPAETGYVAASEAMVDIRATLAGGRRGIIQPACGNVGGAGESVAVPRALAPALILAGARTAYPADLGALEAWLPDRPHRAEAGRRREMLRPCAPFWRRIRRRSWPISGWKRAPPGGRPVAASRSRRPTLTELADLVLDEARLAPSGGARDAGGRWSGWLRSNCPPTAGWCRRALGPRADHASPGARARSPGASILARRTRPGPRRLCTAGCGRGQARAAGDAGCRCARRLPDRPAPPDGRLSRAARHGDRETRRPGTGYASLLDDADARELASWHAVLSEQPAPGDVDAYARSLGFRGRAALGTGAVARAGVANGTEVDAAGPDGATE